MMKSLLSVAMCLCAFPAISAGDKKFKKLFLENTLSSAEPLSRIPVRYVKGIMIVPVVLDGDTCNFVFDTGAMTCALSEDRAAGKKVLAKMPVASLDGAKLERNIHFAELLIGGQRFLNTGCFASDLTRLSEQLCVRIDGIIGANAIRLANWQLRPEESVLLCSVEPFKSAPRAKQINYQLYNALLPLVQVHLGRDSFWTMLDCGYSGFLQLHDSLFFNSAYVPKRPLIRGSGISGLSINGEIREELHATRIDGVRIGDLQLEGVETMITAEKPLLGARFLQRYNASINTANSTIVLEPLQHARAGADPIVPLRLCLDPKTGLSICFIWNAGADQPSGLKVGDRITAINGIDTRNLDAAQWCSIRSSIVENPAVAELRIQSESVDAAVLVQKVELF